jgi:hypothetical protein
MHVTSVRTTNSTTTTSRSPSDFSAQPARNQKEIDERFNTINANLQKYQNDSKEAYRLVADLIDSVNTADDKGVVTRDGYAGPKTTNETDNHIRLLSIIDQKIFNGAQQEELLARLNNGNLGTVKSGTRNNVGSSDDTKRHIAALKNGSPLLEDEGQGNSISGAAKAKLAVPQFIGSQLAKHSGPKPSLFTTHSFSTMPASSKPFINDLPSQSTLSPSPALTSSNSLFGALGFDSLRETHFSEKTIEDAIDAFVEKEQDNDPDADSVSIARRLVQDKYGHEISGLDKAPSIKEIARLLAIHIEKSNCELDDTIAVAIVAKNLTTPIVVKDERAVPPAYKHYDLMGVLSYEGPDKPTDTDMANMGRTVHAKFVTINKDGHFQRTTN